MILDNTMIIHFNYSNKCSGNFNLQTLVQRLKKKKWNPLKLMLSDKYVMFKSCNICYSTTEMGSSAGESSC